jgi:hypothetical protein
MATTGSANLIYRAFVTFLRRDPSIPKDRLEANRLLVSWHRFASRTRNPFDYLTELQQHGEELSCSPAHWMPWNYRDACTVPA